MYDVLNVQHLHVQQCPATVRYGNVTADWELTFLDESIRPWTFWAPGRDLLTLPFRLPTSAL
jgi:hypothetical protein